jgi:hypothetical protein
MNNGTKTQSLPNLINGAFAFYCGVGRFSYHHPIHSQDKLFRSVRRFQA